MQYNEFNARPYETHMVVTELVKPGSKVLDIGCSTGLIGRKLIEKSCKVTGIDNNKDALKIAAEYMPVINADLENIKITDVQDNAYDYILLLDVIEHLKDHRDILDFIKSKLDVNGRMILSTPNIAHLSVRVKLLFGVFRYTDCGILDRNHVHFFTRATVIELLKESGLEIIETRFSSDFGQIPVLGRCLRHIPKVIQYYLTKIIPGLLAVQWIVICRKSLERV